MPQYNYWFFIINCMLPSNKISIDIIVKTRGLVRYEPYVIIYLREALQYTLSYCIFIRHNRLLSFTSRPHNSSQDANE